MTQFLAASTIAVLVVGGATACATKRYVQETTDDIGLQVTSLSNSVESVQEQARENEAQIKVLNTDVQAVRQTAQQASQDAREATGVAKMVEARAAAVEKSGPRLIYERVLSQDDVTFGFQKAELSDAVKAELTSLVENLKREDKDVLIVLEGHTDSTGPEVVNDRLGLERAEAVERYLYEELHIPLHRMAVISYGEDQPIAPNSTREGRAQNRRVVIKILA